MTSKAEKLRQKRQIRRVGRPCRPDVGRTANGRISRALRPEEAPDLLLRRKRAELFGLTLDAAGDQTGGSVIGRLMLTKEISEKQYMALTRYAELADRYRKVMQVPDSLQRTSGGSAMAVPDDGAGIDTRRRWAEVTRAINDAQLGHPGNLQAALNYIVVRDEFHPHMIGDVRIAANALVRYYRIS